MFYTQIPPRPNRKQSLHDCTVRLWLLMLGLIGCLHSSQVAEDNELVSHSKMRPIDVDASITENIGREALEKVGYNEIIKLAGRARFIEYKYSTSIELISYGSEISADFTPVFSRYAVAAAVASQADSPLPGPADLAALGVLVLGIVDAGLLDGYLLNTVADWLVDSGTLLMSENVIDTGIMEKVDRIIAATGVVRTREVICSILEELYEAAKKLKQERRKIQRTQKGWKCRNEQKRQ